jgi:hypothetical protein
VAAHENQTHCAYPHFKNGNINSESMIENDLQYRVTRIRLLKSMEYHKRMSIESWPDDFDEFKLYIAEMNAVSSEIKELAEQVKEYEGHFMKG